MLLCRRNNLDCYLQPVFSLALSWRASPPWASFPFSLSFLHSRFLHLHPPPLQIHFLPPRCQSLLKPWNRGKSVSWSVATNKSPVVFTECLSQPPCLNQKTNGLTCWIIFGFRGLFIRLLTGTKNRQKQSLINWRKCSLDTRVMVQILHPLIWNNTQTCNRDTCWQLL